MPEAIETSRRRFFKALDSLSSSHSSKPSPTSSTTSSKRTSTAAFEEARDRVRKRLRQSTSTTSLGSLDTSLVISLPHPRSEVKDNAQNPPPNFSPWSQDAFLLRLKSFSSVSLWHPKPSAISEVEWAKRGWVCVGVNTVACRGGCERRIVISLDTAAQQAVGGNVDEEEEGIDEGAALEEALSERYKSVIIDGHSEGCLWHKAGCKDDIYRLPVVRPSVWQPELRRRFQSLVAIEGSIKHINTRQLDSYNVNLIHELPKDNLGLDASPDNIARKPFELAMHGWRGTSESGTDLLHCDACFQRVGLWMYQPQYQHKQASQEEDDSDQDGALLDLVEMHREHCPWRNSASQHATGSLIGLNACQVLQRVVSTAAKDHRRRSTMHSKETTEERDKEVAPPESPIIPSRDEIARQDKERESRLRKLKNLLHIKRRSTTKAPAQKG